MTNEQLEDIEARHKGVPRKISAVRDIPKLIAEVRRLRIEVEGLEQVIDDLHNMAGRVL